MTRIIDVIDATVRDARATKHRERAEQSAIKEAAAQPRSDIARDLRGLASALRQNGGRDA